MGTNDSVAILEKENKGAGTPSSAGVATPMKQMALQPHDMMQCFRLF